MKKLFEYYLVKYKLRFSGELEEQFAEDYYQKTLPITRIALVLAFILYAAFGALDQLISPTTKQYTWIIRYAIVCPVIALVFILSFLKIFKRIVQLSVSIVSLVAGFGIIAMVMKARDIEGNLYSYAGLTLVIMWSYALVRLRFTNATIVCWIMGIAYEFTIVFFNKLLTPDQLINAFISNNFFFISINIIGMFISYHMELYTRNDFIQRLIIIENRKKIEEEKDELSEWRRLMDIDLDMARRIQQQIIPVDNPAQYISAMFKPMEPIGGDFYDFIKFRENDTIGIFISDVSGHGVPAALITTMIKSLISAAGGSKLDPAQLLMNLNETLVKQSDTNHVTAFYGIYNRTDRTIIYSCAGHNPPFLIHDNCVTGLNKARSIPLGLFNKEELGELNKTFINHTEILPGNSKLLLYTDGLTETRKPGEGEYYFEEIIDEILLRMSGFSCKDLLTSLYQELVNFNGSENFDDDVCIICVDIE